MKLKDGMITEKIGNDYMAVATGEASRVFKGMIRGNATMNYIMQQLMTDTDEDKLVAALLDKYDVSEEAARRDVRKIIDLLAEAGLLE